MEDYVVMTNTPHHRKLCIFLSRINTFLFTIFKSWKLYYFFKNQSCCQCWRKWVGTKWDTSKQTAWSCKVTKKLYKTEKYKYFKNISNGFLVQVAKCLLIIKNKVDKFYSFYFNSSWGFFPHRFTLMRKRWYDALYFIIYCNCVYRITTDFPLRSCFWRNKFPVVFFCAAWFLYPLALVILLTYLISG